MKPWWERWPGRLDDEINRLKAAGIETELNQSCFDKGIAVLNLRYPVKGQVQNFDVVFPDVYPYMRFEIFAPQLNLDHHQNPFAKNLCMIGRRTANWHTKDTVADFMINRLPQVIRAAESVDYDSVKDDEEIQGEPITNYYTYSPNQVVLIDSSWIIDPSIKKGFLKIGVDKTDHDKPKFAVLAVMDHQNDIVVEAEPEILGLYTDHIVGKWVRCQQPIVENNPKLFLKQLAQLDKTLVNEKILIATSTFIIGVIFPEEVSWRKNKDGWLFLVAQRRNKKVEKEK